MRILFTGGGSGGHLFPIIAVARQLKFIAHDQNIKLEMFFIGPKSFANQYLEKENIVVKTILAGKYRRYFSLLNILDAFKMPLGFVQAAVRIFLWMPDIIFSKGGFGSIAAVIIGFIFRIPIIVHESDSAPGLANKIAKRLAKRIAISFPLAAKHFPIKKTAFIGHPVRLAIAQGQKEQARKYFNIASNRKVILGLGGSLGAHAVNRIVLGSATILTRKYELIHVCGNKNFDPIQKRNLVSKHVILRPFLNEEELTQAYAAADLVVSRAGSGSIYEIAACGKPSIIIPLPGSASEHQRANAYEYARTGSTVVIEEGNLTPHLFLREVDRLLDDPILLGNMAKSALKFSKPKAAEKIARALIEYAG